ncbi:MAG: alpha/beta hydrolase [Alphaproteobacteria bacterium]
MNWQDKGALSGIAYRASGHPEARPVILIHGLLANADDWESTASALVTAGWRTLAPDCPGHGDSSAPREPNAYDLVRVADLLHGLAVALGCAPAVIVGNSMGGAIAQEYAIRYSRDVSALVLVDSAGDMRRQIQRPEGHEEFVAKEFKLALEKGMEAVWDLHQQVRGWMDASWAAPEVQARMKARICRTSPYGYLYADRALGNRRKTLADLARLSVRTLVICCEHESSLLKEVAEDLATTIPNASFEIIPNAWHQPHLENPAGFNDVLLRFLGSLK